MNSVYRKVLLLFFLFIRFMGHGRYVVFCFANIFVCLPVDFGHAFNFFFGPSSFYSIHFHCTRIQVKWFCQALIISFYFGDWHIIFFVASLFLLPSNGFRVSFYCLDFHRFNFHFRFHWVHFIIVDYLTLSTIV